MAAPANPMRPGQPGQPAPAAQPTAQAQPGKAAPGAQSVAPPRPLQAVPPGAQPPQAAKPAAPQPAKPGLPAAPSAQAARPAQSGVAQSAKPAAAGAQPAAAGAGAQARKLKKGELLFAEGENSRAMYFLKSGIIRLFKKKGDSVIELNTVRAGEVLGELAFLDGNPRSASGEALTECQLMEISGPAFQEILARMPDWLKILLKTVVARLRTASTRIRQLESASTAFDYSGKEGQKGAVHYVYLSPNDVLKVFSSMLLVASRKGAKGEGNSISFQSGQLNRYANQIMGIPAAKITTLLDILTQCGTLAPVEDTGDTTQITIKDVDFLEEIIGYLNEENLVEPSKRHDLSPRGFLIMSLIAKHLGKYKKDERTGLTTVNLSEIKSLETSGSGKDPFRTEEFPELVKLKYCSNVNMKSPTEELTTLTADTFMQAYRYQRVVISINAVNEQKIRPGGAGTPSK